MESSWRYAVLAACFLINVLELGTFKSFGVFLFPIKEELNANSTSLGLHIACSQTLSYLFAPLINRTATGTGQRFLISLGGVQVSMALVLASVVLNSRLLGFYFAIAGIGYGMSFTPAISAITCYFKDKANTAIGIALTGGAVGMMLIPPIAEYLIEQYGWRGAMLILGATNANIIVCATVIRPKETQYHMLNEEMSNVTDNSKCSICLSKVREESLRMLESLKVATFTPILASGFLNWVTFSAWAIFLVPHAILKGLPANEAVFLSSIGGIGSIFGRICPGIIIDKGFVTAFGVAIVTCIINAFGFFADSLMNEFWTLSVLAFVNGFAAGTQSVVLFVVCKAILGDSEAVDGYALTGVTYAAGELIGGLVLGYYMDMGINSSGGFMILGGCSIFAALTYAVPVLTTRICDSGSGL